MGIGRYTHDLKTKNTSFIEMADSLRKMGVANNKFHLTLFNENLIGVDPHSEDLTNHQVLDVVEESLSNPWYFLREVVRIPTRDGSIPFKLTKANLASTYLFIVGIDHALVTPVSTYKTMSALALIAYAKFCNGTVPVSLTDMYQDNAKNLANKLHRIVNLLPKYMIFDRMFEGVRAMYTPTSAIQAENWGRGLTDPIQLFNDFEYIREMETIIEASRPSLSLAKYTASRSAMHACRIMVSSPNTKIDFGERLKRSSLHWSEYLLDKEIHDLLAIVEENGGVYVEYTYDELGFDKQWVENVERSFMGDKEKISQFIHLIR